MRAIPFRRRWVSYAGARKLPRRPSAARVFGTKSDVRVNAFRITIGRFIVGP